MCMDYDLFDHIRYLEIEIRELESLVKSSGTGHIRTTIIVLESRLRELYKKLGYYDTEELEEAFKDMQ